MNFIYYQGEISNPFLAQGEQAKSHIDYELLVNNPRAFWWEFERTYGLSFKSVDTAVKCFAYKHSEFAPVSENDIVESYYNNKICL